VSRIKPLTLGTLTHSGKKMAINTKTTDCDNAGGSLRETGAVNGPGNGAVSTHYYY